MYYKNRGSARIMLAGGGVLGLLIVVAIIAYMGGETAEQAGEAKQHVEKQIEGIQDKLDAHGRVIDKMTEGSFDVILEDTGERKIEVIKIVRSLRQVGLKKAEELVESAPVTVLTGLTKTEAENAKRQLELAGATVKIDKRRD